MDVAAPPQPAASRPPSPEPAHEVGLLIRSQYPVVFLETVEEERAERVVVDAARAAGHSVYVWSVTRGLVDEQGRCRDAGTKDVAKVLQAIERGAPRSVYVMLDFAEHLKDAVVRRMLRDFSRLDRQTVVLVGPSATVPDDLRDCSATYTLPLPGAEAIEQRVRRLVDQLTRQGALTEAPDDEQVPALVGALRGLTIDQVDRVVCRLAHDDGRLTPEDVAEAVEAKAELLSRGGVLELSSPRHGLDDVAGFEGLKQWIRSRSVALSPRAAELGLDPPKGFMLTGVPGCGKSFVVKALAREWNMPLLRLDAGALYDKYIGETERNLRSALSTAEALAPSILWIDEIEKGFATTGPNDADGGLSYRLVGTLATWMQERRQPVFLAATSNNISILPPELTRKGRFDEIFFVDLPGHEERAQMVAGQLKMRKCDTAAVDVDEVARAADGHSGAEIEQAVVSALYSALADGAAVSTDHLVRELEATRPLSHVAPDKIAAIRAWGEQHARRA